MEFVLKPFSTTSGCQLYTRSTLTHDIAVTSLDLKIHMFPVAVREMTEKKNFLGKFLCHRTTCRLTQQLIRDTYTE